MKEVIIYTDGACKGNPGPGGWAAILSFKGNEKEISGGEPLCTNNRMELMAVVEALEALKEPCKVSITSDSKYVVDSVNKKWLYSWPKRGWKNSMGDPTANVDLWQRLLTMLSAHEVTFYWVKGHANNPKNERCDELAVEESLKF